MTERDAILGRIREGLSVEAPMPGHHGLHATDLKDARNTYRQWLPQVGDSVDEQLTAFRTASEALKTDFCLVENEAAAQATLKEIATAEGWTKVASHKHELLDSTVASLNLESILTDGGYDVTAMEKCDAGITACDALVAQMGSVLVTSRSAGGRALSVLPPHHIVLARRDQLVPDLTAALQLVKQKYATNYPSFIGFITGPSRTGDIERILVLGAHGPKKLTIICW
jgi:L-lactate dehydrogenase complex protein LldG